MGECTMHILMLSIFSRMPTQEDIDKKLAEYFSRLDPLSVGILAEIEMVKQATADWDTLSQSERDERLDAHFIPKEIQNKNSRPPIYEGDFPHRIMETGQKYHGIKGLIRDEFSSPFHWETQSQMETFYVMEKIDIPANQKETLKQKTEKNAQFLLKLNSQIASATTTPSSATSGTGSSSTGRTKSTRVKPKPPPRAPSTRRQSDLSDFSMSNTSTNESLSDARKYNSAANALEA